MPLVKFNPHTFVLSQISVPDPDVEISWGGGERSHPDPWRRGGGGDVLNFFFGLKIRVGAGPPGPSPGSATEYSPTFINRCLIHVLLKELCHERF